MFVCVTVVFSWVSLYIFVVKITILYKLRQSFLSQVSQVNRHI